MNRIVLVVSLSLASVVAACGAAPKSPEPLGDAVRSYNDGVRWGRFEIAASRIPARERSGFVDDMDQRSKDLNITEYDIVRVEQRGRREARVHVKIGWYLDSQGTLRETHVLQTWEQRGKLWFMVEEVRLRGDEMPGISEEVSDRRASR